MNSKTRISAKALLAVATLAASPAAWSLGLGDATVESYLNQPLRARIDLVTQDSDDLASVSAKLASAADYELIGASLEDMSVPVRFTVEDIDGDAFLLASSNLPMNNPVVRLIVEVNWSSGRMLREYTLFLDPPTAADRAAPLPRIEQRTTVPSPAAQAPEPAPAPAIEEATPAPAPETAQSQPVPADRAADQGVYGPVASGETLWGIARDWSAGTGLGINKVMIAIQRENPEAFLNGNINLLKRGAILRMPEVNDVERISGSAAYNEVVAQEEAFHERSGTAQASSALPLLSDERAVGEDDYPAPQQQVEPAPEAVPEPTASPEAIAEEPIAPVEPEPEDLAEAAAEAPADTSADLTETTVEEPPAQDQLELIPPSEASDLDSTYGFEESQEDGDATVATQALRENLARTEEELITQQQQNEYLAQRIQELEAELEQSREAAVADPDLAGMEQRLREERQAAQTDEAREPWYARFGVWLLGLLIVGAAAAGWLLSRRSKDDGAEETIQEITDEAEEVLRVLEDPEPAAVEEPVSEAAEEVGEKAVEEDGGAEDTVVVPVRFGGSQEEADLLDEESSDPEIQLDLARAYISMGDKEAARVILEEVVANGSGEQQAEAQKMLDLI